MRGLVSAVGSVLLILLGGVISSLMAAQVWSWLPGLALAIVRRQARKMGPESARRFEEEWRAHLDQTPGGLAKLCVALPLFLVPAKTALERWRDSPERLKNLAAGIVLDRGWLIVVAAFIWICGQFPLGPRYWAAYRVLLVLCSCAALLLHRHVRAAFNSFYGERLNYQGRVALGAMVVPLLACVFILWSLVPPRGPAPTTDASAREHARPRVTWVPPPAIPRGDSRIVFVTSPATDQRLMYGTPLSKPVVVAIDATDQDYQVPGLESAPIALAVAQALPAPAVFVGPSGLSEIPGVSFSEQPLPTLSASPVGRPAAPTAVRVIRQ
jgi:hypothetical protein